MGLGRSAFRARTIFVVVASLALAGCQTTGQPSASLASANSPRVAFESIDGMPRPAFDTLVQRLNDEAQARPIAIASREETSTYRVKGVVSAVRRRNQASIVWVWDVYDAAQNRAVRLTGEEKATGKFKDAWAAADDAMMRRVARNSLDQLAAFLSVEANTSEAATSALAEAPRS